MIEGLKPYPAMKDSGLPWLGNMPANWNLIPNRAMLRKRKVLVGERHSEYQLLSLTKAGVVVRDVESGRGKFSADLGTSQEVRCGDLIFCLFDVPETPRTVGLSPHDGMITGAYTVFECGDALLSRFIEAYYIAMDDRKLLSPLYSGLRNTIPPSTFLGVKTPVPPADDQSAIVRFLRHADAKIRRYIGAKQKLIKLLEEERQAIVFSAVTRGLDPTSGTDLLGASPDFHINAEWPVVRLWEVSATRSEKNRPDLPLLSVFLGRGVIPYGEGGGQVHKPSKNLAGYQVVQHGDLVLNNQQAWRGSVGVSRHHGIVSPAYVVLALNSKKFDSRFADYLFRSKLMVAQFVTASKGVGDIQRDIHGPWLKNVRCPLPSLGDQKDIAEFLDGELRGIERQLSVVRSEIELLVEYRTRLISDVVTGKLDVREAAAKLPDAEEPAVLDEEEELLQDDATAEDGESEAEEEAA